ncbi:signal peptidase I [Lysinibacillus parviboronicapiens]|uniref:Signal peptidase I n=1 Tax=Lysinibacillus parviboronicapiens TaxID=436516 RepID=A0ABV2PHN2_9BACI|nr:signal peptidase I [Lysinibacillus parviboronicapiens]
MTKKKNKNEAWAWAKIIGLTIIFTIGVRYFILSPVIVDGASMMPTFEDGEKLLINKIGPRLTNYNRFDIIVFEEKKDLNYIKRIIGLPGDQIAYKDDVLYINGEKYEEPYLKKYKGTLQDKGDFTYDFTLEEQLGEMTVPQGHFFVLGDNRRRSIDSRDPNVGFIAQDAILGTASSTLWPFVKRENIRFDH